MRTTYIPIVRTFCRLRADLVAALGVARHAVRPDTHLIDLLPIERRRDVWRRLRQEGLALPPLDHSPADLLTAAATACKTAAGLALALESWYALLSLVPITALIGAAFRHRAVYFPLGITTVGELVIYLTSYRDHAASGYRWTRAEIALKVRFTVGEALGYTLEDVTEDRSFVELTGC